MIDARSDSGRMCLCEKEFLGRRGMNGRILFDYGNSFFLRMERRDGAGMLKGNLVSEIVADGETEAGFWVKMLDGLKVCLLKVKSWYTAAGFPILYI